MDGGSCCSVDRLRWKGVTYRLANGRLLLDGVDGAASAGRLMAVLGPSGAGKTTLLRVLAGRLAREGGAALSGGLSTEPAGAAPPEAAFVAQDAAFFSNLTVRETVLLTARLRAGESAGGEGAAGAGAEALLARLGLADCADTLVGGDTGGRFVTGISGGERRRLAIACELAGSDGESGGLLVADEPTSGLDSFQADLVVAKLKELAVLQGAIVICSLHQPRSASLDRLDDLCLLAPGGRVVYMGPLEECLPYMEALGHACPPRHNLAEFLVDLVSVDTGSDATRAQSEARIAGLAASWAQHSAATGPQPAAAPGGVGEREPGAGSGRPAGARRRRFFGREFRLLIGRVWRQTRRDVWNHVARTAAALVLGGAYGATNWRLGTSQRAIKSRASLMFQLCITTSMMSIVKTLNTFPRERVTVQREMARGRGRGGYGAGPYFLSKLLVETPLDALFPVLFGAVVGPLAALNPRRRLPFLAVVAAQSMAASGIGLTIGALCPTVDTALALGPALMVVSIMVADESGMFADLPDFMKPLAKLSVVKWGFQGCMAAEMRGLTFDADDSMVPKVMRDKAAHGGVAERAALEAQRTAARRMCLTSGDAVLANLGFGDAALRGALLATGGIYLLNACVTYAVMRALGGQPASRLPVESERDASKANATGHEPATA